MTTTQNKHTFNYLQPTRTIYVYGIFTNKIYIEIYIHLKKYWKFLFGFVMCRLL